MNYAKLALLVTKLLKPPTGQSITITKYSVGTYSTTTGSVTSTSSTVVADGIILDYAQGQTHENGTQIEQGDKQLLIGDVGELTLRDIVTAANGDKFRILGIIGAAPSGVRVINKVHLRK